MPANVLAKNIFSVGMTAGEKLCKAMLEFYLGLALYLGLTSLGEAAGLFQPISTSGVVRMMTVLLVVVLVLTFLGRPTANLANRATMAGIFTSSFGLILATQLGQAGFEPVSGWIGVGGLCLGVLFIPLAFHFESNVQPVEL